jgi:hypothetical protein
MNFRVTLIAAIVLVALLAVAYFGEYKGGEKKREKEEKQKVLLEVKKDDVAEIRLDRPDQKIRLVPVGNDAWKITAPIQSRADQGAVDRILTAFEKLKYREIIEEKPKKLDAYDLDKPVVTVQFVSKKGNADQKIFIGGTNPVDNVHYVRVNRDPRIYAVEGDAAGSATASLMELRDKKLTDFSSDKVERIELNTADLGLQFNKESGVWKIKKPVDSPANDSEISSLLSSLESLRAEQFVDQPSTDPKQYGFDKPAAVVNLHLEKGLEQKIVFGKKEGNSIYCRLEGTGTTATLSDSFSPIFGKKLEDWREKKLVTFNRFDAEDVRIKSGSQEYFFRKGKEDKWNEERPAKGEIDAEKFQDLLEKLESAEIEKYGDQQNLDSPNLEIFINLKDWQNKTTKKHLVFGKVEGNQQQVRNDDYNTIVWTKGSLQQDLTKLLSEIKPKAPSPAATSKKKK